jgi:hypothetical protein
VEIVSNLIVNKSVIKVLSELLCTVLNCCVDFSHISDHGFVTGKKPVFSDIG